MNKLSTLNNTFLKFFFFILGVHFFTQAQNKPLPIIDVHVHAMNIQEGALPSMCPWFLGNMPGADPHGAPPSFLDKPCADPLDSATSTANYEKSILEEADRLNVTYVVSGDAKMIHSMKKKRPKRIIPSLAISNADEMDIRSFRDSLESGFYKVMGEVAPQYEGMSPSDLSLDAYFSIAEELKIPVGIHMGTGGNGMININNPKYRASLGRPFLLEDLLAKHPKLKIWVMHAGYPIIDEMIALMGANAYVYVDLAGFIWSYPLEEINAYLQRLVQAGFGKRILYGTDLLVWPGLLKTSIDVIQNANYLSEGQKRDILFNNAVRFFNLNEKDFY
jgi:predicted TIM-barrel fold metal-dependent hydrolase